MKRFFYAAIFVIGLSSSMGFGASDAHAITVERVVSPKGVVAWLVEDHTNPIIAMNFAFRGGAALDPKGKAGVANLVSGLLDEGAGKLKSQAFQRRLQDISASLRFDAGRDTFAGSLKTLTAHRDRAFDLTRLALSAPRFDRSAVARIRAQVEAGLRYESEDPDTVATKKFFATVFRGHPYAHSVAGTAKSVRAITIADLKAFHDKYMTRGNLVIGVSGDITPAELAPALDRIFGALPAHGAPTKLPTVGAQGKGRVVVVKKNVAQSAIVFGEQGVRRSDPDFYSAYVMNYILGGGGFTSRLFSQVREKRGLAYSVSSGLYPLDHAALIMGNAGTASPKAGETIKVVRDVWRRLGTDGATAGELKDAKTYLTGSFALRFTSNDAVASILTAMQLEHLGIDYLDKRNGYIQKVTLADVNRVAKRLLKADALTFVVAGDPKGKIKVR
ncbi:M16 family metallopeptidase [Varunaivibrio sulfuroxidans]|uniref:Zinc protease n=1 Tax=Varunaivibrio sulfuroxidans TaxID=1773489 RepID=A0A4R3J486_9PROT|nr:pitrilysin family protein [Varunaivibrio sulfuroxidans]TCS60618.1 zinc protease [Varunaivibrio sulfuroxidans]WES30107.1 pitrilysin family protein [Varunaivibrio sulfuroxidans]